MSASNFFEDLIVDSCQEYGSYLVTEEEILEFASKYDPQAFHLSDEAGKAMIFGGLCASGWHTGSIAMRMTVDNMPENSAGLGSPGLDELRWVKPVFPGDTLHMKSTVTGKKESNSRPEMGVVFLLNEVFNQKDELVMSFKPIVMFKKRDV